MFVARKWRLFPGARWWWRGVRAEVRQAGAEAADWVRERLVSGIFYPPPFHRARRRPIGSGRDWAGWNIPGGSAWRADRCIGALVEGRAAR